MITFVILFIVCILDFYRENIRAYNESAISIRDNTDHHNNYASENNKLSIILKSPYIQDLKSNIKVLDFLNKCTIPSFVLVYDDTSPLTKKIMGNFILISAAIGTQQNFQCVRINIHAAPCFYNLDIPHVPYLFLQYYKNNTLYKIPYTKKLTKKHFNYFSSVYSNLFGHSFII
jgi:hypothetical protein